MPRSLVAVVALVAAAACSPEVAGGKADGKAVFAEACARCHGDAGVPPASLRAQLGVKDLTTAEFQARATPKLIVDQVTHGSKNKIMPSFAGALSQPQIDAVAAYVLTLSAPAGGK